MSSRRRRPCARCTRMAPTGWNWPDGYVCVSCARRGVRHHSDPGFTLRTYTHLVPSSYERARQAIDGVFGLKSADGLEAA